MKASPEDQRLGKEWEDELAQIFQDNNVNAIHFSELPGHSKDVDFILNNGEVGVDAKYTSSPVYSPWVRSINGKTYGPEDIIKIGVPVLIRHRNQLKQFKLQETYFAFKVETENRLDYHVISLTDMLDIYYKDEPRRVQNKTQDPWITIILDEETIPLEEFLGQVGGGYNYEASRGRARRSDFR